jgi:hypothetical protein
MVLLSKYSFPLDLLLLKKYDLNLLVFQQTNFGRFPCDLPEIQRSNFLTSFVNS